MTTTVPSGDAPTGDVPTGDGPPWEAPAWEAPAVELPEPARRRPKSGRSASAVALAATVLSAALVVHDIGERSLWYDEAYTVGLVDRAFGDFLWRIANWEVNQSAYYLLFAGWFRLDQGEVFLRLLSGAFVVATVPLVHLLGKRLFGARAGALAAAFFALNAFVLQWGQQLRGYSMAVFLVTAATLLLVRAVEVPSTRRALAYALVAALAVYTNFFAGLVIAAHALSLVLVTRPRPWRLVAVAGPTIALAVAPLVAFFVTRQGDPLAWVVRPTRDELVTTLAELAGGGADEPWVYGAALLLGLVAVAVGVRRRVAPRATWHYLLPVLWLLGPLGAVIVSTYTVKALLVPRFLIVVVPAAALLAGVGIARIPWRPVAALAAGAVMWVSVLGIDRWYDATSFEDWRGATASVVEDHRSGDALLVFPPRAEYAVAYYDDLFGGSLPDPVLPTTSADAPPVGRQRLWVVERLSNATPGLADMAEFTEWRDANYRLVDERPFTNLVVLLYERLPAAPDADGRAAGSGRPGPPVGLR